LCGGEWVGGFRVFGGLVFWVFGCFSLRKKGRSIIYFLVLLVVFVIWFLRLSGVGWCAW
jgi:hypothetical protein